jgi:hypothetical protein
MEKTKKEIERLKQKLASTMAPGLSWEAKRLLQLYAQGLTDWQEGEDRKPWRVNYRQALQDYGSGFASPEGPSQQTIYWLLFMTSFRGGRDSEKAKKSETEFWLLARQAAPKAVEELLSKTEERRKLLETIDNVLAKHDETSKHAESIS